MQNPNIISEKMEKIKTLFQETKDSALAVNDIQTLVKEIENSDNEFRSVCYEAISMALAEKDIAENNLLNNWKTFLNKYAQAHATQFHVGLGWALAKENQEISTFINLIEPIMISKVLDGIGYYDGIFRNRQTIRLKKTNEKIESDQLKHYDQGVGRSIWYNCTGNIEKCKETIETFDQDRQANLWIGIGIACTYVGGADENLLKNIYTLSGKHSSELCKGALMVIKARTDANTIQPDTELVCQTWLSTTTNEALEMLNKNKNVKTLEN